MLIPNKLETILLHCQYKKAVIYFFFFLGGTDGDSVTQREGPVILPEGAPLTLNCTYQSIYSVFLFWYVQYQNKEPELLLKSSSENQEEDSRGFQAKFVKSDSSFHLQKASVQVSDSAVYYCALRDTGTEMKIWILDRTEDISLKGRATNTLITNTLRAVTASFCLGGWPQTQDSSSS
uniref:Ig-like domain-containing protein n=1 Tax=Equus caballus TaxID=9796 RepID=A0A3Q2I8E0_HORSE